MKLRSVIAAIFLIAYFILSINGSFQVPQALNCENKFNLKWLWNLRNNNKCLNLIFGNTSIPKCFFEGIYHSKFVLKIYALSALKFRNILSFQRTNCDNFMIFTENSNEVLELFSKTNTTVQRFLPFSQLFLVSSDPYVKFDQNQLDYIYENGLCVYIVGNTLSAPATSKVLNFLAVQNVLTNDILNLTISNKNDAIRYFGTYKNHPFLNSKFKKKLFRVSLFSCSPYIVYLPNDRFDGLEYRILKEIAKNWTIEHRKCDVSEKINDPWAKVLDNVKNDVSDLALCSIWLNGKTATYYDASNYVDFQCGTFLVPKPKLVNAAAFLYLSIGVDVWFGLVTSLIVMSLSFTMLAKIGRHWMANGWKDLVYVDFSRSLMDALDLATSHGLQKFPKENSMRALFNGWIIVSFLVGVGYSTGYTSLLTKPLSSKPVDTIAQFIENDLVWIMEEHQGIEFGKQLIDTGAHKYIHLAKQIIHYNKTSESKIRIKQNERLGIFVKIISNEFITDIDHETDPDFKLRIMRSCILNYYSVIALRKYSSYTQYFNEKIRILQEFGIISHWGSSIEGAQNDYMRPYFTNYDKTKEEPKKISLQNLSGAFWLLLIGLAMATILLITENFHVYCKNSIRNKLFQ